MSTETITLQIDAAQERLDGLRRKLRARSGMSGFRNNVPLIEAEIGRLEVSIQHLKGLGE